MPAALPPLPIDDALPALRAALGARASAVLEAPPGAGKTTRVPLALLHEPWLGGDRIVMLEPRRLAARAAAARMSHSSGSRVGGLVGYRVRNDTRVSRETRVEVVTEGVLTRMLLDDPSLDGVGLLVFDEFHERNLVADLGLALALQARELLRPGFRILVMSATLDGAPVATLLGDAAVVTSAGRMYPVETRYRERRPEQRVEAAVAAAVRVALAADDGDVLAFLPGAAEIRRTASMLGDLPAGVDVRPLFGSLGVDEQDRAVAPSEPGRRKVVLATSIAETSLTIEGVRIVIDSGLSRVPRFSPRTGMAALETVRVSRAAADQRRGRAGRTAPGVCYRLWAEHEQHGLAPQASPEIRDADLAPLALDLAAAGVADPRELRWLDLPPAASFAQARELLAELGALGADGRITAHGRRMSSLGMHPRLAHMVLAGEATGRAALACDLAALLAERDLIRPEPGTSGDADVGLRLAAMRGGGAPGFVVDRDAARRAREQAGQWRRQLGAPAGETPDEADAGPLLALAYPDRVGRRRAGTDGRYVLRNGAGAAFATAQSLGTHEWIVAAEELDGRRPESRIWMAAALTEADVMRELGDQVEREEVVEWDDAAAQVVARRRARLGAITIEDVRLHAPDRERVAAALLDGVRRRGVSALPWSDAARRLRERVAFLRTLDDAWPDWSDDALLDSSGSWLAPHLLGAKKLDDLARVDLGAALLDALAWELRARLDTLAPTHVTLPTGNRAPVDYGDPAAPALAVRLQELFGLADGPRVGGGRVPLTLQLLSPARRPVQVTRDLAGFWTGSYFAVRKELRGRYPRHHWPENPMEAEPTARVKPRGT